ncbi:L-2-hydroxyglutarate oxidase [Aurantimonas sp. Leaf443]|uniref:L-2-hydroxyglutarate oxidase n=1 Tax=Aurantimonas sp. Leaf443 TaxID=1736378 RepID=UPI0006F54A4F|nr:L-2-hydroxyglutarate oxidase [Aurantimonas sp. Leaf443]KQT87148.1 hydroxyglutarate oxidase [Aurantimonas sp. Leaf443]
MIHDHCVVGGGIVGLATALRLLEARPGSGVVLLEKEDRLGAHQTGHNSGVIHAGLYYPPGSLKAELCRKGAEATKAFCAEHAIPFETCGKLVVATTPREVARMDALLERSRANGVAVRRIDGDELLRIEPNVTGLAALLVPSTGIVDYAAVCRAMGAQIARLGGEIRLRTRVTAIAETAGAVEVATEGGSLRARRLVACAGLQSDRLAALAGLAVDHRIVPFRGEYYRLAPRHDAVVRHLIYPVPDPDLPFLGIHLTRMIDGSVTVGPNAVVGLAREGYARLSVNLRDAAEIAAFPGFWRTLARYPGSAASELRNSLSKRAYLEACRKYCPALELSDLLPHPAGIRAQAVRRDGTLVHDFVFAQTERMLHVCNAPSPAATSALPIADAILARLAK